MALTKEEKAELIKRWQRNPNDTGSPEVQIAILTERLDDVSKPTHTPVPALCDDGHT
jgi:small subunit ribosomal protein S15